MDHRGSLWWIHYSYSEVAVVLTFSLSSFLPSLTFQPFPSVFGELPISDLYPMLMCRTKGSSRHIAQNNWRSMSFCAPDRFWCWLFLSSFVIRSVHSLWQHWHRPLNSGKRGKLGMNKENHKPLRHFLSKRIREYPGWEERRVSGWHLAAWWRRVK